MKIKELSIKKIKPNREQPRTTFDEASIKSLAESIKQMGLLQPIIVTPDGEEYLIVAGERRYRACKLLGLENIKCLIRPSNIDDAFMVSLVENLQREDLSPIEEAEGYKKLMNKGIKQKEIGEIVGKSQSQIAQKLALFKLPSLVQLLIKWEELNEGHGRQLLRFQRMLNLFFFPDEKILMEDECGMYFPSEFAKKYHPKTLKEGIINLHAIQSVNRWSVFELKEKFEEFYYTLIYYYFHLNKGKKSHRFVGRIELRDYNEKEKKHCYAYAYLKYDWWTTKRGENNYKYDEDAEGFSIKTPMTPAEISERVEFLKSKIDEIEGEVLNV